MQMKHVAIIPDGNRRWAKEKGLSSSEGHRVAAEEVLPDLVDEASKMGVEYFTFWAMSTENLLKRNPLEVAALLKLMDFFLKKRLQELHEKQVRVLCIGDIGAFSAALQSSIRNAIETTSGNKKITLIIGLNYGGRNEIVRSIRKIMEKKASDTTITEHAISSHLDTSGVPDPDLIIRTGREKRLSGFMLWQSQYSELFFSDKLFPDFLPQDLCDAIEDYQNRERRLGG